MKLVLHHVYHNGLAWDQSNNFNHGEYQNASSGADGALIQGVGSRVWVRPSRSLSCMMQISVSVTFMVTSLSLPYPVALVYPDTLPALFLEDGGQLVVGNIGKAPLQLRLAAGAVSPNTWTTVGYTHNGQNTCVLTAGGATAYEAGANRFIGSVGPRGISIGNFPEENAIAEEPVQIREVKVFKLDLQGALRCLTDPSHADGDTIKKVVQGLRDSGVNHVNLSQTLYAMVTLAQRAAGDACAGNPGLTNQMNTLGATMANAMLAGDTATMASTVEGMSGLLTAALSPADFAKYQKAMAAAYQTMPAFARDPTTAASILRGMGVRGHPFQGAKSAEYLAMLIALA